MFLLLNVGMFAISALDFNEKHHGHNQNSERDEHSDALGEANTHTRQQSKVPFHVPAAHPDAKIRDGPQQSRNGYTQQPQRSSFKLRHYRYPEGLAAA